MGRLIDADKLGLTDFEITMCDGDYKEALKMVLSKIENAPPAVVYCKGCKYFDHSDFGKGEEYWCKHFVSTDDYTYCHKVTEDDFCSWGEKKEDAENNRCR